MAPAAHTMFKREDGSSPAETAGRSIQRWFSSQSPELVFYLILFGSIVSTCVQLYVLYRLIRRCCCWPVDKGWREIEKQRGMHNVSAFYEPSQPYDPAPPMSHPASFRGPSSVGHVPSILYHAPTASSQASTMNRYSVSHVDSFETDSLRKDTESVTSVQSAPLVLPPPPQAPPRMQANSHEAPVFDAAFEMAKLETKIEPAQESGTPAPSQTVAQENRQVIEPVAPPPPVDETTTSATPGSRNSTPRPTHAKKASSGTFVPKPLTLGSLQKTEGSPPLGSGSDGSWDLTKVDEKPPQLDLKDVVSDWSLSTWQASVNLGRKMSMKAAGSPTKPKTGESQQDEKQEKRDE